MVWLIKFKNKVIGRTITNRSMTSEEICEKAGIALAATQEDYENVPENGMYALEDLKIEEEIM